MRLVSNQSDLSADPEIAEFLFNNAAVDETADPLYILLQSEQDVEETSWFPIYFNQGETS